ncbi:MAG: histidine kinase [Proteobacteria bacterium]|nr:histidine kinase [Pseudomonadota bacterium]
MSSTPLEQDRPGLMELVASSSAQSRVAGAPERFRPYLWILTGFWAYVALSNLLYANNMQASLSAMKVEHIFAPTEARLLQHLFLYPVFILCMWRALRTGWSPLWRALPIQLGLAVLFAALPAPTLAGCEHLASLWFGTGGPHMHDMSGWSDFMSGPEIPIWLASATNSLVTYCFGLALVTGVAVFRQLRDAQLRSSALERALTQAHLATLRMQLSPHTLFNLLHTIRGQIAWDPPAAQTMVVQLGDLLRRLLTAGEREFSRLADELQFVTLYLELQQKRFADRLTVIVPPRGGVPALWVPSLILQPLVENAVVHGLAGHEGAVIIRVEYEVAGESLLLRVSNTIAAGREPGAAGIGLHNVRERLQVQFGERARFSAAPEGTQLWVARISMPLLRDGPEPARAESAP